MYGSHLLVRLLISETCILDICERLERVHCLIDQEVIDRIRALETTYQGRQRKQFY